MRKLLILLSTIVILFAAGCENEPAESTHLQFGELWDEDFNVSPRVKELEGENVSMTGFMAIQSPLDGSFIYLTNAPMVSCPYCIPGTDTPVFAIPAIAPEGDSIEFTEEPVTITGELEVEEKTDEFGYTTPFRIHVDDLLVADAEEMPPTLQEYTMLTSDGVGVEILDIVNKMQSYTTGEIADDELEPLDLTEIDNLINQVEGYGVDSFDPLVEILEDIKELAEDINEAIAEGEEEILSNYREDVIAAWDEYFEWSNEMATIE